MRRPALRVFATHADVEQITEAWGTRKMWAWRGRGELLKGPPVSRRKLPSVLYHMTTNLPAVRRSGFLRATTGSKQAGLGGHQRIPVVSLTMSEGIAHMLVKDVRRGIRFAKGKLKIGALRHVARQDERLAGLKRGALHGAVKAAFQFYKGNAGLYRGKGKRAKLAFEAFSVPYLSGREYRGGHENPILLAGVQTYAKLSSKRLGVVKIRKHGIPKHALTHLYTTGGQRNPLKEVRVAADVRIATGRVRVRSHMTRSSKGHLMRVKSYTRRRSRRRR